MKKIYLILLLNILFNAGYAQNFSWAKREGLWAYDYGYGVVNDISGNVYVAGKYEEEALFSGSILPNEGNHDIFLAKYSAAGAIDWVRTAGGVLGDYAHALGIDASNNLLLTGEIEGYNDSIYFQGSPVTLNCIGDNDIFIAKYDMNGTLLWAIDEGYNYNEKGLGITSDLLGNVYVCGLFTDTTIFNGTMYVSKGGRDIFLAKYDANGNFQWVQRSGSAGRDEGLSVKCDAAGNVYMCGFHSDSAVFDSQVLTSPLGYYDIFLAKYNPSGTLQWVKSQGSDYDDVAWAMTLDNTGQIYITGEYNAYATFDALSLTTSGNADIYVACYDASGTALWVKSAGGPSIDRARGIACDGTNLFITGQFGGTALFDSFSVTAADSSDVYIAALNSSGNFMWATSVGGAADSLETLGYESGNGIAAEAAGNIYATGTLLDGGVFGSTSFTEYGRTDIFVAKLLQAGVGLADTDREASIHLYPNPNDGSFTLDLAQLNNSMNELWVYNYLGQVVEHQTCKTSAINIDLRNEKKGIYFIKVLGSDKIYRAEVIVQ